MKEDTSIPPDKMGRRIGNQMTSSSRDKSVRIMLLAILFQIKWPMRLTREEIVKQIHYYGEHPNKALDRDLNTLTGHTLESLPRPDDEHLEEWCATQQQLERLAITYDRQTSTFGLAKPAFTEPSQKAPFFRYGDEWLFLMERGMGPRRRAT